MGGRDKSQIRIAAKSCLTGNREVWGAAIGIGIGTNQKHGACDMNRSFRAEDIHMVQRKFSIWEPYATTGLPFDVVDKCADFTKQGTVVSSWNVNAFCHIIFILHN